ncbi:BLUF domain-containing protein [Lysobacter brunescens]|uniref:BLUF domain-containing protein n=1 Tax=Lysobacter brunescens TaxID=262323 RepID=A0ABW2Y9X9_9GAMM
MTQLHGIVYLSTGFPMSTDELHAMLIRARDFNREVGVSGVLFHHAGRFFQYFEGPEDAVARVHDRILRSPMHHSIRILMDAPIEERAFSDWYMGFCEPAADEFEAVATAQWVDAMPITRTQLRRSEGLALAMSYWSRWIAERPELGEAKRTG